MVLTVTMESAWSVTADYTQVSDLQTNWSSTGEMSEREDMSQEPGEAREGYIREEGRRKYNFPSQRGTWW